MILKLAPRPSISGLCSFPDTVNRVVGLYLVLEDIAQNAFGRRLSDKQTADLSSLIKGMRDVLEEMTVTLGRYKSLGK